MTSSAVRLKLVPPPAELGRTLGETAAAAARSGGELAWLSR